MHQKILHYVIQPFVTMTKCQQQYKSAYAEGRIVLAPQVAVLRPGASPASARASHPCRIPLDPLPLPVLATIAEYH
jgi:hypothetical protein